MPHPLPNGGLEKEAQISPRAKVLMVKNGNSQIPTPKVDLSNVYKSLQKDVESLKSQQEAASKLSEDHKK
jgi:hypothetical protein